MNPPDDWNPVPSAIAALERGARAARRTLGEIENYTVTGVPAAAESYVSGLHEILAEQLDALRRQALIVLDLMSLRVTRANFLREWPPAGDLGKTKVLATDIDVFVISRPLELIEGIVRALGGVPMSAAEEDGALVAHLATLEFALRSIPRLLKQHEIYP